jgi:aldehyde dehydrogenase (NAD+)
MTVCQSDIFETMDYGPAPEAAGEALAWLDGPRAAVRGFIERRFTEARRDLREPQPRDGRACWRRLTQATAADVDAAVAAARKAQPGWAKAGRAWAGAGALCAGAAVQKHARLFAVLETLDNGKPIRESRDIDVPLVARHFYFHAGMAQLMEASCPTARRTGSAARSSRGTSRC